MSFFKQLFPEQRILAPEASQKLRGLKGFLPEHMPALQDPFYAEDPVFWTLGNELNGAAGFLGKIGVEVPADRALLVIVDGFIAASANAELINMWTIQGSDAVRAVLNTDPNVHVLNRRQLNAVSGLAERAGILRISDNANALTGQSMGLGARVSTGSVWIQTHFGLRLFPGEQWWLSNSTVNVPISARVWGRLASKRG